MDQIQLTIQTAIKAWEMQISRTDKFLSSLDDASLTKEIAPGKNRISYLIGHLIAVNDNIHAMFGMSERSYAHLDEAFVKNADRATNREPGISDLREDWKRSNEQLSALFSRMTVKDWLSRHTAMTDEDYLKEPTRNKLAVLMNRTSHVAYHLGQLALATPRR
jgi:hypothetical protein